MATPSKILRDIGIVEQAMCQTCTSCRGTQPSGFSGRKGHLLDDTMGLIDLFHRQWHKSAWRFSLRHPVSGPTIEGVRQEAKKHLPISEGALVFVNGKPARPSHVLKKGDSVEFTIPDVQRNS
jgi:hypothetical protein